MPFSSGLESGGYAGRVQMSPRGPRSLSVPTDPEAQRKLRSTMSKLGQGCGEPMVASDRTALSVLTVSFRCVQRPFRDPQGE